MKWVLFYYTIIWASVQVWCFFFAQFALEYAHHTHSSPRDRKIETDLSAPALSLSLSLLLSLSFLLWISASSPKIDNFWRCKENMSIKTWEKGNKHAAQKREMQWVSVDWDDLEIDERLCFHDFSRWFSRYTSDSIARMWRSARWLLINA